MSLKVQTHELSYFSELVGLTERVTLILVSYKLHTDMFERIFSFMLIEVIAGLFLPLLHLNSFLPYNVLYPVNIFSFCLIFFLESYYSHKKSTLPFILSAIGLD